MCGQGQLIIEINQLHLSYPVLRSIGCTKVLARRAETNFGISKDKRVKGISCTKEEMMEGWLGSIGYTEILTRRAETNFGRSKETRVSGISCKIIIQ